jgi:fructokinase
VDSPNNAPADDRPVLSIGELLIDLIVSDGSARLQDASAFVARAGGAPANVAVALSRLAVKSAFCGVIGDDPFGERLRGTLQTEQVDDSRVRATSDSDSTIAFAWKDGRGDGHFRIVRMADRLLSTADVEQARIAETEAIVVGSVALAADPASDAVRRAVDLAAGHRVPVCFDVNLRPSMWSGSDAARIACQPIFAKSTLIKFSLDDARYLFDIEDDPEQAIAHIMSLGVQFSVLADGARGAWFATAAGAAQHVPAFAVDAIEPTGAGDAFTAAVIARLIDNDWSWLAREDILYASAAGALTSTRRGAMDALPTADAVRAFVAKYERH